MDTKTDKPLPFGSLCTLSAQISLPRTELLTNTRAPSSAIHKKNDFQDATVCLFLFDILYVDGKVVMNEPLKKRRQILEVRPRFISRSHLRSLPNSLSSAQESVMRIPHRIEFSEYKEIADLTTGEEALSEMMDRVLKEGLEGLMIKDIMDVYKPDKRHWLKLKKGTTNPQLASRGCRVRAASDVGGAQTTWRAWRTQRIWLCWAPTLARAPTAA
jgi:DNA ligase-3